jgi:hypothetical protein
VLYVDCRSEHQHGQTFTINQGDEDADGDEGPQQGLSPLAKYKRRLDEHFDVTYLDFLLHYNYSKVNKIALRPRGKPRVLSYFPIYREAAQAEYYARVKLMLHHPFRDISDSKTVEGIEYESFYEAYIVCQEVHAHPDDFYRTLEPLPDDELEDIATQ